MNAVGKRRSGGASPITTKYGTILVVSLMEYVDMTRAVSLFPMRFWNVLFCQSFPQNLRDNKHLFSLIFFLILRTRLL